MVISKFLEIQIIRRREPRHPNMPIPLGVLRIQSEKRNFLVATEYRI